MVVLNEERNMDMALLGRCQLGELAAFDELVNRYQSAVFNIVYRFLGDYEQAGYVACDTFLRAYRTMQDYPVDLHVHTWLFGIAGNLARNVATDVEPIQQESAGHYEEGDPLQYAIEQIPEQARLVFVLGTVEGLTYEEISEVVGCPRGTVKSRMNQARVQLRDTLKTCAVL